MHFIRTTLAMFCLVTVTSALPLHPGAKWLYFRTTGLPGYLELQVLDSTTVRDTLRWNLRLRDFVMGKETSLQIGQMPDGRQVWTINPNWIIPIMKMIPWDPTPPDPHVFVPNPKPDLKWPWPYPWGEFGGVWVDSLGWVWKQDWILLQHDGVDVESPWTLKVPAVGASWRWKTLKRISYNYGKTGILYPERWDTTTSSVSWEILERPSDSAGWLRLRIRQTRLEGESLTGELRIHPRTRERSSSAGLETFDASWWHSPQMFQRNGFLWDVGYSGWQTSPINKNGAQWITTFVQRSRAPGTLDSLGTTAWEFSWMYGGPTTTTMTIHETVLVEIDGQVVGVRRENRSPDVRSLQELAQRYPGLSIRWRDAQGRGGLFPASSLEEFLRAGPSRLRFLDARLPDGTRWSGKVF